MTTVAGPHRQFLPGLTSLRGVAAWTVVLHHYTWFVAPDLGAAVAGWTGVVQHGYLCVDFFFVLSGFLLAHLYRDALLGRSVVPPLRPYVGFLRARIARIYPLHLVTLGLVALLAAFSDAARSLNVPEGAAWRSLLENLLLLQAPARYETTWNQPAWSISAEWVAYLTFPLLLLVDRLPRLPWCVVPPLVLAALAALETHYGSLDLGGRPGVLRCMLEAILGVWAFRLHRIWRPHRTLVGGVWIVGALGALAVLHGSGLPDWTAVPAFALVTWSTPRAPGALAGLLGLRPLRWSGDVSYSIYMLHWVLLTAVLASSGPVEGLAPGAAVVCGLLAVTGGAAAAGFRLVEVPARAWIRGRKPAA